MASLQALLEKRKKLEAQIQQARSKEAAQKRKEETRRKILVGAAILEEVTAGTFSESELRKILDARLVRSGDRLLFGLPPKANPPNKPERSPNKQQSQPT
ncbi:MAG: mobilization protein [Cyanobacteriota bacterium]